jgi:hypothetical protein
LPCEANQRSPKGLPGPSPSTPVIPICVCRVFIFMDTGSGPTSQPGCALDGREIGTYSVPPSWTFFPKKALSLSLSLLDLKGLGNSVSRVGRPAAARASFKARGGSAQRQVILGTDVHPGVTATQTLD